MVSSPKKRVLEKKTSGIKYNQVLDYLSAFALIYVLAMNSYWSNAIRNNSGSSPKLDTESIAFILTTALAGTAGFLILYLVFRPTIPYLETYRNTLAFSALALIIFGALLLREVYYYYQYNTPLGSNTPLAEDDGEYFQAKVITAELGSCFAAIVIGCFIIMKEL